VTPGVPLDHPPRSGGQPAATSTVEVIVERSDPEAVRRFTVARQPGMKLLDVLVAIQHDHDPSIGFRYSCRVAMCGTCGLRMDGTACLACQTGVPPTATTVHLAPLAGLPVVRDLVVDPAPFFARWAAITPYLVPDPGQREPAVVRPDSPERLVVDPALDCITCGICYSACAVSATNRDFLGPAALNRAMVLIADSRDTASDERLKRVSQVDGIDRCHYIGACAACCPKGIDPFAAIRQLRRWRLTGVPGSRHRRLLSVRHRRGHRAH
jgi:succinate dehydrogenase / fumarate reductase iron-sulfur subunit/fumarate reductase iron-sulfur subunit